MSSRLSEYIPEQAMLKELLQNFHKIKIYGGVCTLKMVRMFSLIGALKTLVLLFEEYFRTKQKQ